MAGAQFEYDETSGTFFYFLISFYALLLVPATYYALFWTSKKTGKGEEEWEERCHCEGCEEKAVKKRKASPWARLRRRLVLLGLGLAWLGFFLLARKVSTIQVEDVSFDPYKILGLDHGATDRHIKKAYHKLSLKLHPDRGGDPKAFVALTKAYAALTDEEAKKNWDQYGNPDGPTATTFGIALPKWLVSKEYGIWVLAAYGLVFMIILPTVVGIWWYNSIKYSADQVLMDTTQLYGYMFHKTPNMILRRILMILGASFEFWKQYNKEVVERPSDDREVPMLLKELSNLSEKNKERPLCFPYSVKARALLHAHLSRIPLNRETLDQDRLLILVKCPALVQEMITIVTQLVGLAAAGRVQRMPSVDTVENVMRLSPMLVQALWEKQSPLLQLPHFTEDMLRYCMTKRRRVKTCADLAELPESERRSLFRNLSEDQYEDVRVVLAAMPVVAIGHRVEVVGEEDKHHVTAGSLVTVHVHLTRTCLGDVMEKNGEGPSTASNAVDRFEDEEDEQEASTANLAEQDEPEPTKQRKPWEKPAKKTNKKKNKGGGGKNNKKPMPTVAMVPAAREEAAPSTSPPTPQAEKTPRKRRERKEDEGSEESGTESEGGSSIDDVRDAIAEANQAEVEDDEDDLVFDDELIKKERLLETKSKITHPVHCPYFPGDKYEWWWVYLVEKKNKLLISGPVAMTTLVSEDEVQLRFQAPPKPGTYAFTLTLRSDSYLDADVSQDIKLEVGEARVVTAHPQWDFPSDEEEHKSESEHSEGSEYTEGEEEDDD